MKDNWRNISRIRCYPTESSDMFFCEVHHQTPEGSTLDGFTTHEIFVKDMSRSYIGTLHKRDANFGVFKPRVSYHFDNKDGYCELKEKDDLIEVICGKEPTFGELLEKRV